MAEEKLAKLRQGQEITPEFLNTLVTKVNKLIDEHEQAALDKQTATDSIEGFRSTLEQLQSQFNETLDSVPNFVELLNEYLRLTNNTISFEDKVTESDSPLVVNKNLNIVLVPDITPYTSGTLSVPEKTILLEKHLTNGNRVWLFYKGTYYNFSTDATGSTVATAIPTISIDDDETSETYGHWFIGDNDTGVSAIGPQGERGERGLDGMQGPQGNKGDTGMQGPQGVKGQDGKTSQVLFCSANDQYGNGLTLNQIVDGTPYIGLKFVYTTDSQAEINAKPWYFIKVLGDTFYPHINATTGMLYFDKTRPTSELSQGFNIKGPKGDTGPQGETPIINFIKNGVTISPQTVSGQGGRIQTFDASQFKGDDGAQGPQGPKGDTGLTGPAPTVNNDHVNIYYDSTITQPRIVANAYPNDTFGFEIRLPKPANGETVRIIDQKRFDKTYDPDNFPNGYTQITFEFSNGVDTPTQQAVKVPMVASPYIGGNGHWWVGNVDTGVNATGPKGEDAIQLHIKGACYVNGTPTIGNSYGIYRDSEKTNQIESVEAGDCYLSAGYIFVAQAAESTAFLCAGNITGEKGDKGDTGATGKSIIVLNDTLAHLKNVAVESNINVGDIGITSDFCLIRATTVDNVVKWIDLEMCIRGEDGSQGINPHIGANGNWWTGPETDANNDTDEPAREEIANVELITISDVQGVLKITTTLGNVFYSKENGTNTYASVMGPQGVGIYEITGPVTSGKVDTYKIVFTDSTLANPHEKTFTVTNGNDGVTPHIGANGNWWTGVETDDNNDTGVEAQGPAGYTPVKNVDYFDGQNGADGATIKVLTNPKNTYVGTNTSAGGLKQGDLGITSDYYLLRIDASGNWELANNNSFNGARGNSVILYTETGTPGNSVTVSNASPILGDIAICSADWKVYKYEIVNDNNVWVDNGTIKGATGDNGRSFYCEQILHSDFYTTNNGYYNFLILGNAFPCDFCIKKLASKFNAEDILVFTCLDTYDNQYFTIVVNAGQFNSCNSGSKYRYCHHCSSGGHDVELTFYKKQEAYGYTFYTVTTRTNVIIGNIYYYSV